jgi:ribosomal protein S18 acetylase RimI-like enzyme
MTKYFLFINIVMLLSCFSQENRVLSNLHIEAHIQKAHEELISYVGGKVIINETIHYAISGFNSAAFNQVTYCNGILEDVEKAIKYIVTLAERFKIPIAWFVFPSFEPNIITSLLLKHGFKLAITLSAMVYDCNQELPTLNSDVIIKKIAEPHELQLWSNVIAEAFNFTSDVHSEYLKAFTSIINANVSKLECYGAYFNDKLVGTGNLLLDAEHAYVFKVTTDKNYRNKGIATTIMHVLLKRAQELNIQYSVLDSSPEGTSLYRKIGFKHCFDFVIYSYKPV